MKIGSQAHKHLFCESLHQTHRVYEPEQLSFPELDEETLTLLRSIPFWEEALTTEQNAGAMLKAYADIVDDRMLKDAIALQAYEEARHGRLIKTLLNHYGIDAMESPVKPLQQRLEPAFTQFGFSECFDSFFAFGLFGIAHQAQAVPESLFTLFDPILHEEARHMVFFVNWFTYQQIQQGKSTVRGFQTFWHYGVSLQRRLDSFLGGNSSPAQGSSQQGFTATGAKSFMSDLTLAEFLETCVLENEKRMSLYPPELLRPQFLPKLTGIALRGMKFFNKQKSQAVVDVI